MSADYQRAMVIYKKVFCSLVREAMKQMMMEIAEEILIILNGTNIDLFKEARLYSKSGKTEQMLLKK